MLDIEEVWNSSQYIKLREELSDKLCFITFGGSHAYGTNVEGSDIDIRGVMLPTVEELIGLNRVDQKLDEETDTCIYSFMKFVNLARDANPNVIEMLGCREYLVFNEVGEMLLDSVKHFLSKRCSVTFGGYAVAQLRRIENALCHDEFSVEQQNKHIMETMNATISKLDERYNVFKDNQVTITQKDEHLFVNANFKDCRIDEFREAFNSLLDIEHTYNKLNKRNDKKTPEKMNKHIMHLVRLYLMCFDILEKGELNTYRPEREFLLEIRNGKFLKDGKLTDDFYPYLDSLKQRLDKAVAESTLPSKPNFDALNKLVIEVHKKVVDDTVKTYRDTVNGTVKPLKEVIV